MLIEKKAIPKELQAEEVLKKISIFNSKKYGVLSIKKRPVF